MEGIRILVVGYGSGLGLTALYQRKLQSGAAYDQLIPKASGKYDYVDKNATVSDTIEMMRLIVAETLVDTEKLYPVLAARNQYEYCRNVWNFLYHHIQYKLDKDGTEELRRPRRAWADRRSGIDCDCFSIFVGSLLVQAKIKFSFRITAYSGDWQHVYVIAHLDNGQDVIIDCVLDQFDEEKPYSKKRDYAMKVDGLGIPLAILSGVGTHCNCTSIGDINGGGIGSLEYSEDIETDALNAIKNHLIDTRNYIIQNPDSVLLEGGARVWLQLLDYALANWDNPQNRAYALDQLEQIEKDWNEKAGGVSGFSDYDVDDEDYEMDGFGAIRIKIKKPAPVKQVFKKVNDAVKKVASNPGAAIKNAANKVSDAAKKAAKGAVKAIAKFNPLNVGMRGGFLLAIRTNLFRMGSKLLPALSNNTAKYSRKQIAQSQNVVNAIKKLYEKMGGKFDTLKKQVLNGKAAKKAGLKGIEGFGNENLGAALTAAAVLTAAPAIMTAYAKIKAAERQPIAGFGDTEPGLEVVDISDADTDLQSEKELDEALTQIETDAEGNIDPVKATGFIKKILEALFKRKPKVAGDVNNDTTTDPELSPEGRTANPLDNGSGDGSGNGGSDEEENGLVKFVKENPGKTAIGATLLTTAIVLVASPKARKAVGLGAPAKQSSRKPTNKNFKKLAQEKAKVKQVLLT